MPVLCMYCLSASCPSGCSPKACETTQVIPTPGKILPDGWLALNVLGQGKETGAVKGGTRSRKGILCLQFNWMTTFLAYRFFPKAVLPQSSLSRQTLQRLALHCTCLLQDNRLLKTTKCNWNWMAAVRPLFSVGFICARELTHKRTPSPH